MNPDSGLLDATPSEHTLELGAWASIHASPQKIAQLRTRPSSRLSLAPNVLKHADEQTIVSLAAALEAIQRSGLDVSDFVEWGIVAAPCFMGRAALAQALSRFAEEGAWGISPHLIPHRSQHAVSGTLSQLLKIHGPNLGTGGGTEGILDGLLAALALIEGRDVPGVLIVLSDWEDELIPKPNLEIPGDLTCIALAMLARHPNGSPGAGSLSLSFAHPAAVSGSYNTVSQLCHSLREAEESGAKLISHALPNGAMLTLKGFDRQGSQATIESGQEVGIAWEG